MLIRHACSDIHMLLNRCWFLVRSWLRLDPHVFRFSTVLVSLRTRLINDPTRNTTEVVIHSLQPEILLTASQTLSQLFPHISIVALRRVPKTPAAIHTFSSHF